VATDYRLLRDSYLSSLRNRCVQAGVPFKVVFTVLDEVRKRHGLDVTLMLSKKRIQSFVRARNVVCECLHRLGYSYPQIGMVLERHHSSVMHACRQALACGEDVEAVLREVSRVVREAS
jgi:chromosomal replication initiation ATPase DnaA